MTLLKLLFFLFLFSWVQAAESLFYIASAPKDPLQGGIWMARLNLATGALSIPELATPASNPSFLTYSPSGKYLFSVEENKGGTVNSYLCESNDKLTFLSRQPSGGNSGCHVEVDLLGKTIFTANYGSGTIASFPILEKGMIGEAIETIDLVKLFSPSDPLAKSKAHGNYIDFMNRLLYACDLGTDTVGVFRFDPEQRRLTPFSGHGKLPPKSGPRHLAIHPSGKWLYVNQEMGLAVSVFERDANGGIDLPLQSISTVPPGIESKGVSTAEILCHPSGKWLYVSNRGHDSITQFAVSDGGKLSWVENSPSIVKFPRSMALDPSGSWLIVAGQKDKRVTSFAVDSQTGKIRPTDHFMTVDAPICLIFKTLSGS